MGKSTRRAGALVVAFGALMAGAGGARGQVGAAANPLANPYANPFLNPAATVAPLGRDAALYYFLAAQRAQGGLGSGRLGESMAARPAAEMPGEVMTPGAGASHYFGRGPAPRAAQRRGHFGRNDRYFMRNGR